MLKRKIYEKLINWKKNKGKQCLLVKGARQVGKTYIVDVFGKNEYKSYIHINFFEKSEYKDIFDGSLEPSEIYRKISLYVKGIKFIEKDTLIFLDEIQHCPNARTALKFLAEDNKYDVIASGSLLGLHYKEIISIPVGYEMQIEMYSLDFEEFLWASGVSEEVINGLKKYFDDKNKVEDFINEKYLSLFTDYMIVGGMPQVVNDFIVNKNYQRANEIQNSILNTYRDDIIKYAEGSMKQKILATFNSIPIQLAKEYTKFQYKTIEKNGNKRKYDTSIEWLIDAGIVKKCNNVSKPEIPLVAYNQIENFKVYMLDTGLLTCMYGFETQQLIRKDIFKTSAKGGIYENVVFEVLIKNGLNLKYYKTENNSQEIEFIFEKNGTIVPVEVKSKKGKTISLNNYIETYKPEIAYKIVNGNVGFERIKYTIPYYMLMYIK